MPEKRDSRRRRSRFEVLVSRLQQQTKRRDVDWWQRASTIASILSSVVIATAGILVTSSIQRSQLILTKAQVEIAAAELEVAKQKNEDEQRQEETKLAADLFPQLLNRDPAVRALAVSLLRHRSVKPQSYDDVLAVLATNDQSGSVRKAAIQQLTQSDSKIAGRAISEIALNSSRPEEQRLALAKDSESVYLIRASLCEGGPVNRIQSGFRLRNVRGIITALHGLLGCQKIEATTDSWKTIVVLTLDKVDIARNAALAIPKGQQTMEAAGLEEGDAIALEGLWGLGYAVGNLVVSSSIEFRVPPKRPLRDLIPFGSVAAFAQQGTPNLDVQVMVLEGHVVPGMFGGPLLNKDNQVVGFLDGREVEDTAIDIAWAIPIKDLAWQNASSELLQSLKNQQASRNRP